MCDEISSYVVSVMPDALLDKEKSMLSIRQAKSAKKESLMNWFEKQSALSEQMLLEILEHKRMLKEEIKQLSTDVEQLKKEVYNKHLEENIIRNNIMTQKQMLSSAKKQIPDEEELSHLMEKVGFLKEGLGKKKSDLKMKSEIFQRGLQFYKKYLHCTVTFLSKDTLIFTFDTSTKSVSEARGYLKFSFNDRDTTFELLEVRPKLQNEQQLLKTFKETGDVQGLVASYWSAVKGINSRKCLSEKN